MAGSLPDLLLRKMGLLSQACREPLACPSHTAEVGQGPNGGLLLGSSLAGSPAWSRWEGKLVDVCEAWTQRPDPGHSGQGLSSVTGGVCGSHEACSSGNVLISVDLCLGIGFGILSYNW